MAKNQDGSITYDALNLHIIAGTVFASSFHPKKNKEGKDITSSNGKILYNVAVKMTDEKVEEVRSTNSEKPEKKITYINERTVWVEMWKTADEKDRLVDLLLAGKNFARVLAAYEVSISEKDGKTFTSNSCYIIAGKESSEARQLIENKMKQLQRLLDRCAAKVEASAQEPVSNEPVGEDLPF